MINGENQVRTAVHTPLSHLPNPRFHRRQQCILTGGLVVKSFHDLLVHRALHDQDDG